MPTISVMVKNFNAQYQDQNIGVRLSGAGCGLLGIVCSEKGEEGTQKDQKGPTKPFLGVRTLYVKIHIIEFFHKICISDFAKMG